MTSMSEVISLAEWKAKHPQDQRQRRVPVYVPVRDPDGRRRLELVGHTELEAELKLQPIDVI